MWPRRGSRRLEGRGASSGPVLDTHLDEIYHDAVEQPGTGRIVITAQLVDPANGAVLARRTFSRTEPATSCDAAGAVQGLRRGLGALLDDVVVWVNVEAPRKAPWRFSGALQFPESGHVSTVFARHSHRLNLVRNTRVHVVTTVLVLLGRPAERHWGMLVASTRSSWDESDGVATTSLSELDEGTTC